MCTFFVTVQKGALEVQTHFYGDANNWKGFGNALIAFPTKTTDYLFFQSGIGSYAEEKLLLKSYCYDSFGHAALTVNIDHQKEPPNDFRIHFSIPTEVASLNQLGRLLATWEVTNDSEIHWQAQTS
ncbi:hypothetical protein [Hymenobacter swuensis]|uniref:hypothetical protein n=1 Tax=Hymenobacter swuensis TaxID=1446467 RepID=UPI0018CC5059|nr:hypothetical protein [Hymenobacter swuensis]